MWRRRRVLAALHGELKTLEVFDRVHDLSTHADPASQRAYAIRQKRRSEIVTEMEKLKAVGAKSRNPARASSAAAILCVAGYAMIHYFLK